MKKSVLLFCFGIFVLSLSAQDLKWENANKDNAADRIEEPEEPEAPAPVDEVSVKRHRINVSEGKMSMSQGSNHGFSFMIPDLSEKEVKSLWKDLMKEYGSKPKKVKKSPDMMAGEVRISGITGSGAANIYSQTERRGNDVAMTVWFDMGDGNYLNSRDYPNSAKDGEAFLQKFGVLAKKAAIENELKAEQKELARLNKDLKNLTKKKANLEKDIENFKKKIVEAEQAIVENEAAQAETENMISEQQMKVEEVSMKLKKTH